MKDFQRFGVAMKARSRIAYVAIMTAAGMAILPAAQAETSRRVDVPAVHSLSGNELVATSTLTVSQTFTAGDCTEYGNPGSTEGSSLTLTLTDGDFGDVNVHWHGAMATNRSFSHDVWHARFDLKNSSGNVLTTISGLDGPGMVYPQFYEFDRFVSIHMSPSQFLKVAKVDWWGDC